jgi:hypothetical protein
MPYYMIKSKLTGFVLDIEGGILGCAGHKVIPYDQHGKDNQLWYDDPATGTIRSKHRNLCLAVEHDQLCVQNYKEGDPTMQWERDGQFIRNRVDKKVLDILKENKEKGAHISSYHQKGGLNQCWEFDVVPGHEPPITGASTYGGGYGQQSGVGQTGSQFYIVSELNGKVVDIEGAKVDPGQKIHMWEKHPQPARNQLWYQDSQGHIRSALNDMAFTNTANSNVLKTVPPSNDMRSQWFFNGNQVTSRSGDTLDISHASKHNGADVISFEYKGGPNQQWRQEFL